MGHPRDSNKLLEVPCDELRPVVGDDAGFCIGILLPRPLDEQLDLRLGHRFVDLEVDDGSAVAVEQTGQVIEGAGDVDVGDIDVPVLMGRQGLLEAGVPVDVVSGTSFGALVGAFYAAKEEEGLAMLRRDLALVPQEAFLFSTTIEANVALGRAAALDRAAIEEGVTPFTRGTHEYTRLMKTVTLRKALDDGGYDAAIGGSRRDEERSRAKERIFSFRDEFGQWDPKNQRPELWRLYNARKNKGESIRVFPISNWTELDIWQYIYRESIPIVPLYYAAERPVVERNGMLIMVDDDRFNLLPGETIEVKKVRFRTLGCYPLTGAVESSATDLSQIVLELLQSRTSEREGRAIDSDSNSSMEKKKQEGYF